MVFYQKHGERFPKRLVNEVDRKKDNWKNILEKKRSLKEIKLQPSKTHHLKAIKRFLVCEYLEKNKAYVLTLRTYSVGVSELNTIKSKKIQYYLISLLLKNQEIIQNLFRIYCKVPTIDERLSYLNEAHTYKKTILIIGIQKIIFKILLSGIGRVFILIVKIL